MFVILLLQVAKTAAFSRQRPYSNYNQNSALHTCNLKPLQASSAIADVSDGWLSPQQIKTLRKEIDDRRRRKRLAYKRLHDGELAGDFDQATVDAADAALASLRNASRGHHAYVRHLPLFADDSIDAAFIDGNHDFIAFHQNDTRVKLFGRLVPIQRNCYTELVPGDDRWITKDYWRHQPWFSNYLEERQCARGPESSESRT